MNAETMLNLLEAHYGEYPRKPLKMSVYDRIEGMDDERRQQLFDRLLDTFEPTQVRPVPDPPAIKRAMVDLPARHRTPALPSPDDIPSQTELRDGASFLRGTVDALAKRRRA